MSEFAKKQLEKYGWKEGKGLGRDENGISAPIKTKYKFDTHGVGHDSSKEYTSAWWNYAFNEAANSIDVINDKVDDYYCHSNGVRVTTKKQKRQKKKKKEPSIYGCFVQAGILSSDGTVIDSRENPEEEIETDCDKGMRLTDEELFSSCSGRTAHKGARFGLTMKGKLKRLSEQENHFTNEKSNSVSQIHSQPKKKRHMK